jgi:ABC-type oligopeptide transport system substrate-binding subunit
VLGNPVVITLADYLEAQWPRELGVRVSWEYTPRAGYWDRVEEEQPHLRLAAYNADYPDPDNFLRVGFGPTRTEWRNAEYDRLVGEARELLDQGKRMDLYRRADRILVEEAPFLVAIYTPSLVLVKPWVRRYSVSPMACWSPWKDVVIEPH